jgi:aconitate hydratase
MVFQNYQNHLKVLLENLLRYEDDLSVTKDQIEAIKDWLKEKKSKTEIAYRPARVLLARLYRNTCSC